MKIKEAVTKRISELCKERGIALNDLAVKSGITPSTIYSLMGPDRHDVSISTIKKICDGLDMSITDFFNSDLFTSLEQEIS